MRKYYKKLKKPYKVRTLNSRDLKNQGKLVKKLNNFRAFTKFQNENNRTEVSSIYDFSIETNNVKLIETDSLKTYTFKVNRAVDNGLFENLQITKKVNDTYVAKLLQYNLTSEEKALFLSGENIDVNGKLATINIDDQDFISDITSKSSGDCYETVMIFQEAHNCLGEESHSPGDVNCPYWFTDPSMAASYDGYEAVVVSVDCYGGGDDGLGGGVITTPVGGGSATFDAYDTFYNSLSIQQMDWLDTQPETVVGSIYTYLIANNYNTTSSNKIKLIINYLMQNPNVTSETAYNLFFKPYPELSYSQETINPNNITYDTPITIQALPSLSNFTNGFPKNDTSGNYSQMSASGVYNLVGGTLLNSFNNDINGSYSNACSIRGSRGLLYSNSGVNAINIPVLHYNGSQRTQKGGDLKNYILDAVSFNKFMIDKFGETANKLEGAAANDPAQVAAFLNGKNGIYVIINNSSSQAGYSGHVDLILNGSCIGAEYTNPTGGVKSIRVWALN
jgi:hypothetical protein